MEIVPSVLVILAAVIVAAVPWGLPGETTFILPFITLLLVFVLSAHPKRPAPVWLVFLGGLVFDILTAGPLGYWAFLYTLGHTLAGLLVRRSPPTSVPGFWLRFALTVSLAGLAGWLLALLYYLRMIDWWPIMLGCAVAVAIFPIVALPLRRTFRLGRYQALAAGG